MSTAEIPAWPARIDVRVAWGEMDAYLHLNNTVYFRHFESVRMAYFEEIGLVELMEKDSIGGILSETRCRFKAPVTYPDTLAVIGRTGDIGEDRFTMNYEIHSEKLGRVAAEGNGTIVIYDYKALKRIAMPDALRSRIVGLENNSS